MKAGKSEETATVVAAEIYTAEASESVKRAASDMDALDLTPEEAKAAIEENTLGFVKRE